ncbi:hypothetical protein FB451DRAFT_1183874 [Mycena latifolia]|nr:hypothetical protein FB451DRAFT_1183874 [Mycena latifolia]
MSIEPKLAVTSNLRKDAWGDTLLPSAPEVWEEEIKCKESGVEVLKCSCQCSAGELGCVAVNEIRDGESKTSMLKNKISKMNMMEGERKDEHAVLIYLVLNNNFKLNLYLSCNLSRPQLGSVAAFPSDSLSMTAWVRRASTVQLSFDATLAGDQFTQNLPSAIPTILIPTIIYMDNGAPVPLQGMHKIEHEIEEQSEVDL